jgi:MerR family copper efflux transcriptional regulator
MQIGEVAERVGLSLRTIRYYEEVGLVPPSSRTAGGFRLYAETDVDRLRLITRMKPLGYTVEEMGQVLGLLDALEAPGGDRPELLDRLGAHHDTACRRVDALQAQADAAREFAADLERRVARHQLAGQRS